MEEFDINFIDHVALRVNDMERSAKWYEKVFRFKRYQKKEWGPFPILLLTGKTGIALFPSNPNDPLNQVNSQKGKIDHFAFNLTSDNFEKAKKRLNQLKISYNQQNHIFFESLYINDPDGHQVELTTLLVSEDEFYQRQP